MAIAKNWMLDAAREIDAELEDAIRRDWSQPAASRVALIIAKHCQMLADVAYMPVPRCDQCAHWMKDYEGDDGICRIEHRPDASMFAMPGQGAQDAEIVTRPDFGCVQWKNRPRGDQ